MTTNIKDLVKSIGKKAKEAASKLSIIEGERKNKALKKTSEFIHLYASELIEENNKDIKIAIDKKLSSAIVDRLTLNQTRINDMITSINKIVEMEDPIGKVISEWKRPNGLHIKKISVPIGVIGLIYESRPNVTVDASAISIKSGNSLVLRGGKDSFHTLYIMDVQDLLLVYCFLDLTIHPIFQEQRHTLLKILFSDLVCYHHFFDD